MVQDFETALLKAGGKGVDPSVEMEWIRTQG